MLSVYHNLCEKAHAFLSNSATLNCSMSKYVNDDWSLEKTIASEVMRYLRGPIGHLFKVDFNYQSSCYGLFLYSAIESEVEIVADNEGRKLVLVGYFVSSLCSYFLLLKYNLILAIIVSC